MADPMHGALRDVVKQWVVPEDNNYTSWKGTFNQKIDKFCKSESWYHSGVHSTVNPHQSSYFNGLASEGSVEAWHDALIEDRVIGEMAKVGPIIIIVLGILFLIMTCVFAFCCKPCLRQFGNRICCRNYYEDRPRVTVAMIRRSDRCMYTASFGVLGLLVLAMSIVSFVCAANIIKGQKDVNCDAWLTFKGQFFGTSEIALTDEIRGDWKGTVQQNKDLAPLLIQTNPARPNVLYDYIWDVYQDFKLQLDTNTTLYVDNVLPVEIAHLSQVREVFKQFFDVGNTQNVGLDFNYVHAMQWVAPDQTQVYSNDLLAASTLGKQIIEKNIELLLGEESPLLQRGYGLATAAKATLEDVDFVFAGITQSFEHTSHLLNSAVYLFSSVVIVSCASALILIAIGVFIFVQVGKGLKRSEDYVPKKWMKVQAYIIYIAFLLLFSVAFLSTGISWLLGKDGSEICQWIREDLGVKGNWAALDPALWNVTLHNTTDMELVLDTCVTNSGTGDIVSALGLTAATEDLRTLVYQTEDALRHEVKTKLDLYVKGLEAGTIQTLFKDMNSLIWQAPDPREKYWPESLYVVPFVSDFPVAILCVITGVGAPAAEAVNGCRNDFSVFTRGLNVLNDKVNSVTQDLEVTGSASKYWCTKWLSTQAEYSCPAGSAMIDDKWTMQQAAITDTIEALEAAYPDDKILSAQLKTAFRQLIDFEKFLWIPLDLGSISQTVDLSLIVCDDKSKCCVDAAACTMNEMLGKWRTRWLSLGNALWMNYVYMNDATNVFLEDVTIKVMEDLLDEADATLQHFDCQFAGTSLKEGVIKGLCDVVLPSSGFVAIWLSMFSVFSALLSWIFFKIYHYLDNLNMQFPPIQRVYEAAPVSGAARKSIESSSVRSPQSISETVAGKSTLHSTPS